MNILFFGDIIGRPGREAVKKILPKLKTQYRPDLIIANGENLAHGFGISQKTAHEMFSAGIDVLTGGNHSLENKDGIMLFTDGTLPLLRPLNFDPEAPGKGYLELTVRERRVVIVNLQGIAFMRNDVSNPFTVIEHFLKNRDSQKEIIVIDWHAEATSEKVALGKLVDGRVCAVFGTHTHVPTADYEILPGGTAFVSDVGMCGPKDSVIGMEKSSVLQGFLTGELIKYEVAEGPVEINAMLVTLGETSAKATKIDKIHRVL